MAIKHSKPKKPDNVIVHNINIINPPPQYAGYSNVETGYSCL